MPKLPNLETTEKMMPGEVARLLGVTTKTVSSISELNPIVLPSGHRRYIRAEVMALVEKRNAAKVRAA